MSLTHSPADVLRYALINAGGGSLPSSGSSWPIGCWQENETPDNVITLYDTSGNLDGRFQTDGEMQEHPGIQIRVRSANPLDGNTKIRQLMEIVDKGIRLTTVMIENPIGTAVSTYVIYAVTRIGTVLSIGKDTPQTKRSLFTVNMIISLRQTS